MGGWYVVECATCGRVGRARKPWAAEATKQMHESDHTDWSGVDDENGCPNWAKVEAACLAGEAAHPVTITYRNLGQRKRLDS